jgi:hypothetical protein
VKALATQILVSSTLAAAAFGALAPALGWAPAWRGALTGALFGVWTPAVHYAIAAANRSDRAAAAALRGGLGYWLGAALTAALMLSLSPAVALVATIPFGIGGATGAYLISRNETAFTEAQRRATSHRDGP